jgi:hypothetical protein
VKQLAFVTLPVQINGTWNDNRGVQALLQIEKALTRHKRVMALLLLEYWLWCHSLLLLWHLL